VQIRKSQDAGEKPLLVTDNYDTKKTAKKWGVADAKVEYRYNLSEITPAQVKKLKPEDQKKVTPAVILDGEGAGKRVLVMVRDQGDRNRRNQQSAAEKRRKLELARNAATFEGIVAAAVKRQLSQDGLSLGQLRAIVPALFDRLLNEDQKKIAKRRGWDKTDNRHRWGEKAAREFAAKADQPELLALLVEIAIQTAGSFYAHPYVALDSKKTTHDVAAACGVDVNAIARRVASEQKQAAKAKTKKKAAVTR
jgi:hypothetical protein